MAARVGFSAHQGLRLGQGIGQQLLMVARQVMRGMRGFFDRDELDRNH